MKERWIGLSIVEFVSIQEIQIHKKINEHGRAEIRGIIHTENEEKLFKRAETGCASLFITDEAGEQRNLFSGIIDTMEVEKLGEVKSARIVLTGATRLMDCIPCTRTFQNEAMPYKNLLGIINSENGQVMFLQNCGQGRTTKKLIVQYRETDWEFASRLASHFNQPLIPNYEAEGIRYSFGLCEASPEKRIKAISYSVGNAREEYLNKNRNGVPGILPDDFAFYLVKSRDCLELGDKISFLGQVLYIYEVESRLEGEELIHAYILRRAGGFRTAYSYNDRIVGASLDASVTDTRNDTVKISVNVDQGRKGTGAKWFPYSTVYSSPDGTGWYCMPEKDDRVRLYFPSEREEEAYVISAINYGNTGGEGKSNAPRSDPDRKSISNRQGKQIELTPTTITMTNNNGMSICLDDDKGIEIKCNKNVEITANGNLTVKSDTGLDIQAADYIELVQGDSKLTLRDELEIKGTKFNVQ